LVGGLLVELRVADLRLADEVVGDFKPGYLPEVKGTVCSEDGSSRTFKETNFVDALESILFPKIKIKNSSVRDELLARIALKSRDEPLAVG
jgi:hypothetical protein